MWGGGAAGEAIRHRHTEQAAGVRGEQLTWLSRPAQSYSLGGVSV